MTAIVGVRTVAAPVRRRRRGAIVSVAAAGWLVLGGSAASADQTVEFDDAGDAPHISLIGDSTLAGVRWYGDYGPLERFNFVFSAESCRRTIDQSCVSREGYRSDNVITALRTLDGRLGEVLVVMSGYNDPRSSIDEAIDEVVAEARGQGVEHVVWLSLRASDDVDYSDPQELSSINTFREYNEQLVAAAAASNGFLQVADWSTYSTGASGWFEADGVHLTPRGVDVVTDFIGVTVARVLAGEDVSPAAAPWTVLVPGAEGETVTAVQEALLEAGIELRGGADGIYGDDTMVAVAEYQRRNASLQQTGAVDVATARALDVYEDPVADRASTSGPTTTIAPSAPVQALATDAASGDPTADVGRPRWPLVAAAVLAVAAGTVIARRRSVVARRARRWARVHPATSPRRSVADLRRAGDLPPAPTPAQRVYDHQREEAVAVEAGESPPR